MLHVLVHLYAGAEGLESLRRYESQVLPFLAEHGGQLLSAFRPQAQEGIDVPDEIHLLEFPSTLALDGYRNDRRVRALRKERQGAIARMQVYISKELVEYELIEEED